MSSSITTNLHAIRSSLPQGVTLVAVSKYHPVEALQEAYNAGQRVFGESREQELAVKQAALPSDIEWHFIGHLQTNKVRFIAPYIHTIEAVDSLRLLQEIERQAARHNRCVNVLLELHVAQEESKYGMTLDECRQLLNSGEWRTMTHVQICGLMTMASYTDNEQQLRQEFTTAAHFFNEIKQLHFPNDPHFCQRSWGMSGDYPIALQCHSNVVRVGTAIFGER